MERIRATIQRAWSSLRPPVPEDRRRTDPPRPGRPRDPGIQPSEPEREALGKAGFAEEALPWLDAVYRFALRLTRDPSAAEDLAQETFLKAFRSWDRFERGTNCRSWLFTICRNTYLHERERASTRREISVTDLARGTAAATAEASASAAHGTPYGDSPDAFFEQIVDERLLEAIDALPDEFHDVLVMSDLGDLTYPEIAEVLDIPIGTVKSRLSRARRQVRDHLVPPREDRRGARG